MDARAYLLIEADAGEVGAIIRALHEVPGIHAADAVTGPYDIIATIETSDQRMIGRLVIDEIHRITGIKRTITCLTIPNGWQNTAHKATIARSAVAAPDQSATVISHRGAMP